MTDVSTAPGPLPTSEIPGPPWLKVGQIRQMRRHAPSLFSELRQQYGTVVSFPYGTSRGYLLSDPRVISDVYVVSDRAFEKDVVQIGPKPGDRAAPFGSLLGRGLATSAGDFHRHQRRLIQPLFHRQRIHAYGETFADHARTAASRWRDGQELDILDEMLELTLGIVARAVFDVSLDDEMANTIRVAFPRRGGPLLWEQVQPFGRHIAKLPLPNNIKFRRGRKAVDKIIYQLIDKRRRGDGKGSDLLSVLLAVQDADTGERMDDVLVRDEALTLLMAGHETSAAALTWAYHLLSHNPSARDRLFAEIDDVLGKDRLPGVADLPRLAWVDAVVSESLRLYPPVWATVRRALVEYTGAGYVIPANSLVMISPWVVHHDPTWWPQPEAFAPQRWIAATDQERAADPLAGQAVADGRPRLSYLPFGAGPRQCIGNAFARMEAVMALATIGRHWDFEAVVGESVRMSTHIATEPRRGIPMIARARG